MILKMLDLAAIADVLAGLTLVPASRVWTAIAVTVAFTSLARWVRGVSPSGAVAGAVVCFLLYAGAGPGAFAALATVFVLTWITTRLGYRRKQALGTAEKRDGRRASQVLANLGVAGLCAAAYPASQGKPIFLLLLVATLSEAAADTVSSELGQASSSQARLITTWELVPAGTNGGVSLIGTLSGIAAATVVSLVCVLTGLLSANWFSISVAAAFVGMVADSYLGAWLEHRRWLNNDSVNLLGTLAAAGTASLLV